MENKQWGGGENNRKWGGGRDNKFRLSDTRERSGVTTKIPKELAKEI